MSYRVRSNLSGARLTTFGLGGELAAVYEPCSIQALSEILRSFHRQGQNYRILGAGSNILIPDCGITEPVIHLAREFNGIYPLEGASEKKLEDLDRTLEHSSRSLSEIFLGSEACVDIVAFSAVPLMSLSREACNLGLEGLEFAAGIPASLGGAIRMNAGAHGSEIKNICQGIWVLLPNGEQRFLPTEELEFDYRSCKLSAGSIILGALLRLRKTNKEAVLERRNTCLQYRKDTQPLQYPSAGSVFRNPEQQSAGALLEEAGLSGVERGGVCYSEKHCNWIVRKANGASASHVLQLIELGQERVQSQCNITLQREVICW